MDTPGGMVKLLIKIIKGTFLVEGAGALLFAIQFIPEYGILRGVWYSVFHSVSAFCNAGIDILGETSFIHYAANPVINLTTMSLIVVGGLGFTVWGDVLDNAKKMRKTEFSVKRFFRKLSLHTKIVITVTCILIVAGTASTLLLEYSNPETFGNMSGWEKFMAACFHSVSTSGENPSRNTPAAASAPLHTPSGSRSAQRTGCP